MTDSNRVSARLKLELDILTSELDAWEEEQGGRSRVLLVCPEEAAPGRARKMLAGRFDLYAGTPGDHLLDRAHAVLPDCIVAAMDLPDWDGLALGRRLQEDPFTMSIPFILLGGLASEAHRVEAFAQSGADALLGPSVSPIVLRARVAGLIAKRERIMRSLTAHLIRSAEAERTRSSSEAGRPPVAGAVPPPNERRPERTDSLFLQRLRALARGHLSDSNFGVAELAATAGLSRSQLYRRLKREAPAGEKITPSSFLRAERLRRARTLLRCGDENVTQVCHAVGFDSLSYFSRQFRERYGHSPSEPGALAEGDSQPGDHAS